ncbi:MAG TPA: hypothetical protein VED40_22675 [Azospirillaceae bacterium]|nr:hypothetical protein [Azospirillaceae bacterium]
MTRMEWQAHLPEASRPLVSLIPTSLHPHLTPDDARALSPEAIRRLAAQPADLSATKLWNSLFRPSALTRCRMEAPCGQVAAIASERHPWVSYVAYLPLGPQVDQVGKAPLIVDIHGSSRNAKQGCERFADLAEAHGCYVLAPLFPMIPSDPDPDEQYKFVAGDRRRYDLILLDVIAEFSELIGVSFPSVLLHGFSGGGQFAHRFWYAHPDRLRAVSIGAPGYVTLPDATTDWRLGVRNFADIFDRPFRAEALGQVTAHFYVGEHDTDHVDVYSLEELGLTASGYRAYGHTRIERLGLLHRELGALGVDGRFDMVPGLGHAYDYAATKRFFAEVLAETR